MKPELLKSSYFGKNAVKFYNREGIGFFAVGEDALKQFLDDKIIDNLDYIEALVVLRKIKEKQNARHGPNRTMVEKDGYRL